MGDVKGPRSSKSKEGDHRDPYDVLGVPRNATDQQIKAAYRKMALKLHPDKNADNPEAAELFKEVAFSYSILSDVEKRRQYDAAGFQAVELDGLEVDLSNLGTVNTMFAAIFSKLGVPIKTSISPTVLEEALNESVQIRPLSLGQAVHDKVEKQGAHFYGVYLTDAQAASGLVVRVYSTAQSKFKLLYFEPEENGGLGLALQEDSTKTGKVTSAGMYFLHFQVYRLDTTMNALAMARDPDTAFFRRLEGLQPCEVLGLRAGSHVFAVYGDNFFKSASYTIEAVCADSFKDNAVQLQEIEDQIMVKRNELRDFEAEYREALNRFTAVTHKYGAEKSAVDILLKNRDKIHASFSTSKKHGASSHKVNMEESNGKDENSSSATASPAREKDKDTDKDTTTTGKEKSKKKWFGFKDKRSSV
ncbi:hypothetical protein SELMODRAFT_170493 [Selaginella moellendorffii]|uniref:J domain-containing protein n=1 Tax=Selaginella moellendorffii TaxID=88036 RepID=D8RDF2_SELML|nr:chaperone protein dnaJ 15 [Selaginella moellendorffii]EFJ30011.1 hypothetical protein SELMODRAFT_170493 [Selaginella moellendorffii]|eukprot:XP_024529768.1 chaperone protein dnaJ 15 [Selaginella moellendorffii]